MTDFQLTIYNKRTYLLLEIDTNFNGILSGIKIRDDMPQNLRFLFNGADTRFYKDETFQVKNGKNWIRTSTGYLNWTSRDSIQLRLISDKKIYSTPLLNCPLPRNNIKWNNSNDIKDRRDFKVDIPDSEVHIFIDFINHVTLP